MVKQRVVRRAVKIGLLAIIGMGIVIVQMAQTSASEFNRQAKSGQPTLIGHLYDCKQHVPPGGGGVIVEHGTVTLKDVTQNQCGNPNEPTREVWYTSAPGFKGVDQIKFPWGKRGIFGVTYNVTVQ